MWLNHMLAIAAQSPRRQQDLSWNTVARAIYLEAGHTTLMRQYPAFWSRAKTLATLTESATTGENQ
jgi:hypothetical protein